MRGLGLVALLTAPFGVAVHLVAECAALRPRTIVQLTTSGRHNELFALAVLGVLGSVVWILSASGRPRERAVELLRQIPYAADGPRFFALALAAQLAWFAGTQLLEGAPMLEGNLPAGLATALLVALGGTLALRLGRRRLAAFTIWICRFLGDPRPRVAAAPGLNGRRAQRRRLARYFSSHANRPPPSRQVTPLLST